MSFARNICNLPRSSLSLIRGSTRQLKCNSSQQVMTMCYAGRTTTTSKPRTNQAAVTSSKLLSGYSLPSFSKCNYIHTEGDKELVHFLQEEIAYEQENIMQEPKFRGFEVAIDGAAVSLVRDFNGERVEVCFDVNENINVDEGILEDEEASMEEVVNQPDIISYPQFNVKITKPSGRTLQFNCTCNNMSDELEGDNEGQGDDEQIDLFRFDSMKIYEETQNKESCYEAETENMDGELYSNLMTTLLERGITGTFVNELLDLSTAIEHKQYLRFLRDLQSFAAEK